MGNLVLGIETSCDETAAAVLEDGKRILSNIVSSQISLHREYGGIVPELASRSHVENISTVIHQALIEAGLSINKINSIAVTTGPGLIGALLVGLSTAKAISYALGKPLIGVNHLEGHIFSIFLEMAPRFPFVSLVVSGGHTDLYLVNGFDKVRVLGRTRDDAAGECFDKCARILGLGYPGGPLINKLAEKGDSKKIKFPRPMISNESLDFSFSGLKTSMATWLKSNPLMEGFHTGQPISDISASFQEAVVDVLVSKTFAAVERNNLNTIVVSGGVACNTRLRERFLEEGAIKGIEVFFPDFRFCTDNAAMIALTGYFQGAGKVKSWNFKDLFCLDASANL